MTRIKEIERQMLMADAKTLDDISTVLVADGRFHALPGVLKSIAGDIRLALSKEGSEFHDQE